MISQILATDMINHAMVLSCVKAKISEWETDNNLVENKNRNFQFLSGNEKTKFDEQQMMLNYLIHTADLGHNTKKFSISIKLIHNTKEVPPHMNNSRKILGYLEWINNSRMTTILSNNKLIKLEIYINLGGQQRLASICWHNQYFDIKFPRSFTPLSSSPLKYKTCQIDPCNYTHALYWKFQNFLQRYNR